MDFEFIYKLKTGKFWWMDVILYFVLALLISLIASYFLLTIKISSQEKYLEAIKRTILETGTPQQKELESKVFEYQKKINNFAVLLKSHKISSNMFSLVEKSTLPDVWFSEFRLNTTDLTLRVSGESQNMQALAQQMDVLREDKNIKKISLLSAKISEEGKINFTLGFLFSPQLLAYLAQ